MSKKRTSSESNDEQQTNDGSDSAVFQPDNDAKRAKLASLSDTTLHDLPLEMFERILVKAVSMEVKSMKLAKSVWKEKTDLVISRLRRVCSQWSSFLTTNFFRNELHRTLDSMAQETIRLEILHQSPIQQFVFRLATLKDDIFMLTGTTKVTVYDRNNMAEVKDIIPIRGIITWTIEVCIVSKCVYVLGLTLDTECDCYSVLRITKEEEHRFNISPWISDARENSPSLAVSANGNLLILSEEQGPNPAVVSIYNANGSLQREIMLSSDISDFRYGSKVLQKRNGNLILVFKQHQGKTRLTEVTMSGIIVRQYESALSPCSAVTFADIYDRIVISEPPNMIELLDSELNLLNFTGAQLNGGQFSHRQTLR